MKNMLIVITLGAALALTGCSNTKMLAQKDAQIGELQSEVTRLNQEVSNLENDVAQQQKLNAELKSSLADLEQQKKILMEEKDGLTHITMDGAATFGSAQAWLTDDAKNTLDRIWGVLRNYPDRRILIEGHTDNRNISTDYQVKYPTNWELSTARALSVLHYLTAKYKVDYARFAAVGYGPSQPVASNDTAAGRAQNRRVVITVGSSARIEQRMSQPNS
jgi:chemotaxis protein MotB